MTTTIPRAIRRRRLRQAASDALLILILCGIAVALARVLP